MFPEMRIPDIGWDYCCEPDCGEGNGQDLEKVYSEAYASRESRVNLPHLFDERSTSIKHKGEMKWQFIFQMSDTQYVQLIWWIKTLIVIE